MEERKVTKDSLGSFLEIRAFRSTLPVPAAAAATSSCSREGEKRTSLFLMVSFATVLSQLSSQQILLLLLLELVGLPPSPPLLSLIG